jgi:hypothetical protein
MRFLANGDFYFPFDWMLYIAKHIYIWSFQNGTPNPDGLIRLPGRLLHFLVYGLTGNIGFSYFYLISSLAIAFVAFFFFARHFLQVKKTSVLVIGALFFACNPIFLGNLAKVGLVLAAAMLPLCLLAIRAAFIHKRFRYFLLLILCLNISFLHPYTFTVNLGVSAIYTLYMIWRHRAFALDNIHKFVLIGAVAILFNLYFILPLISMGTVSKDVISTNVTPSPVDYTALVGVSNTGDFFTGFSLSKNVFKDFEFYNNVYQSIYFCGVFLFYVLLLGLYLRVEQRMSPSDKRLVGIFFGAFLICLALAATTVLHIDKLIEFLIGMPGGWAFRSPLKWQLYIPLALFGILVILLRYVKDAKLKKWMLGLVATFILMNAFLLADVYKKILVPRTLNTFGALMQIDMERKTVLSVNSGECMDYMRANPRLTTELNQVFTSKNTQLKHVLADDASSVNLGSYDYILDCKDGLNDKLSTYQFTHKHDFANGSLKLYANQKPPGPVSTPQAIYALDQVQNIGNKYDFVTKVLGKDFSFTTASTDYPATTLHDVMADITPHALREGTVSAMLPAAEHNAYTRELRIRKPAEPLFYRLADGQLTFSATPQNGLQSIRDGNPIELPADKQTSIRYEDSRFSYSNLLPNGSFEDGLWQNKAQDCYNYDNQPVIGMRLSNEHTDGRQSLQLEAKRHIACTGAQDIAVKSDEHYLLSFDYQSLQGKYAGYYVQFDDPDKTVASERMQKSSNTWQTFSKELTVPKGASTIKIMLYAYPDTYGEQVRTARYDNLSLVNIPPLADRFYAIDTPKTSIKPPNKTTLDFVNPTKRTVQVRGATTPFYLATAESYNPLWRLKVAGEKGTVSNKQHIELNNTMNGWYVDPVELCRQGGCQAHADSGYDFAVVMEFEPQRQFYMGAVMSSLTLVGGTVYFVCSHRRDRKAGKGRWRWR